MDDILLVSNDMGLLNEAKDFIAKNSKMKDMSEVSYVIGNGVHQGRIKRVLGPFQQAYIEKVLTRFIMNDYSFTSTPIVKGDKFINN